MTHVLKFCLINTGWAKKSRQTHDHNSVRSQPIFKILSLSDSPVNLKQVTLRQSQTNDAIKDKLQGSAATYLR